MKVFEIVQTKTNNNLDLPPHGSSDELGDGSFAYVVKDPSDPHMAIRQTDDEDPHTAYIDAILSSNLMSSNPYFPRVYQRGENDDIRTIQMERLSKFNTINSAELDVIVNQVFGVSLKNLQKKMISIHPDLKNSIQREPIQAFVLAVGDAIQNGTKKVKDPQFLQALQLIKKLKNSSDYAYDLHDGNYLIRRGPTGVQLVFADPLYVGGQTSDY